MPDPSAPVPTNRPTMSPDGGPPSRIQITQNRYPLVEMIHPTEKTCRPRVNAHDVPEYEKAGYVRAPIPANAPRADSKKRERPSFSSETEQELLTWTVRKLRAMPECQFIEGTPSSAKADLVRQILEVRSEMTEE